MSDIAINPVTRRVQFTGNTGTGPFAFTFNILIDSDIAVYKGTVLLTLTTDYTVSINANGTGSITLTAALVASDVLTIIGGRELSRTTDFVTAGDLLASSLNEQLDSNVIMTQQLDEKLGRGLFVNPGDVFTDLELPLKDARKGTVLGFNATTGDPEPGPEIADVDLLANISADIKTLAEIQDGTVATDAITNVNTIRTDVTTVSGISTNVTTVANNTSNINIVSGNTANITNVAGISSDVTTVSGISSDVTIVAADGADIGVVAGISSDVTTVSGKSVEIGRLGTADAVADMNTLAVPDVLADMDSLADNVSAISVVAEDIGYVIAVAINASNINTVAADGADIGTVAGSIASVNTVAGDISNINANATNIGSINTNAANITDIQNASANAASALASKNAAEAALDEFTDIYLGAKTSDPTTDNDGNALTAGDQYFNTTLNVLKIYNGSAWQAAAIDSSGFVEVTGDTMTGDLSFGDNDKAIFGAGSDLQIYHDGSNSYIKDNGTGNLRINAGELTLTNAADNQNRIVTTSDGTVYLYNGGSIKLATTSTGVDITGTLTSDALTVDGNPVLAASVNNSNTTAGTGGLKVNTASTSSSTIPFYVRSDNKNRLRVKGNGDFELYEDTGITPKMVWSAADEKLEIGSIQGGADGLLAVKTNANNHAIAIEEASGVEAYAIGVESDGSLGFYNSGSTTASVTFDDSGNVGIGTASPDGNLTVGDVTTAGDVSIRIKGNATSRGFLMFGDSGGAQLGDIMYDHSDNHMRFRVNNSERMRIDSSGNLLVGKTSAGYATDGFEARASGYASVSDSGATPFLVNRNTDDGNLIAFYKSGSTVGSIGVSSGDLLVSSSGSNPVRLQYNGNSVALVNSGDFGPANDNFQDLGSAFIRWDDIYATNGTIQTSDRNDKQDIEALSDAEQRVAVACKGLLRKFRWKDAVAEKGDDARIHFGIIAQDLQDAFAAEGLDAGRYAMFISSTWTDEETGEERTRMGVRYPELLAFIIAAI